MDIKQRLQSFRNNEPNGVIVTGNVLDELCRDALAEIKRLEDRQHVPSIVLELERRVEVLEEHALNERIEALERWRDRMIASNR